MQQQQRTSQEFTRHERRPSQELMRSPPPQASAHVSPFEFTRELNARAFYHAAARVISAGRGNPNFLLTDVRDAYALLLYFATHVSSAPQMRTARPAVGLRVRPEPRGITEKLKAWLARHPRRGADFLVRAIDFIGAEVDEDVDRIIFELVDAVLGDNYPDPPRVLSVVKPILRRYLHSVLFSRDAQADPIGRFSIFATEGATAAMIYIFHSLRINRVLVPGNKVAIITPIFSPYLEIPRLEENGLVPVYLETTAESGWSHLPESEIAKLRDPEIKALFVVNPMNPSSRALDRETVDGIAETVLAHNPKLIVISDNVYAPFCDEFSSLIARLPSNTIGVFSFSKYFGVTGWRLGVVLVHENCVVDSIIKSLPKDDREALRRRYTIISKKRASIRPSNDYHHIKFSQRLVADSRSLALAHTAGLSTPQQVAMCLFALYDLLDSKGEYRKSVISLLRERWEHFYNGLGLPAPDGPRLCRYYALIDVTELAAMAPRSPIFAVWFTRNTTIESFLDRLAADYLTIVLPGKGFQAPNWTVRVSLANIDSDACEIVGRNLIALLDDFHNEFLVLQKEHEKTSAAAESSPSSAAASPAAGAHDGSDVPDFEDQS